MKNDLTSSVPPLSRTREFLHALCAMGPRLMGSELESEARSFVSGFFRGLGIPGTEQSFAVPLYERGSEECALVHAGHRTVLAAAAVERCPATDGTADLPLADAGDGSRESVERILCEVAGKALYSCKPGANGFAAAAKAGAAAWIEPCSPVHDKIRMAYMPEGLEDLGCARVKLKASSGAQVAEALASGSGTRIELLIEGLTRASVSANLEFTLEGRSALPHVLIGAHLDTFSIAPGATDNGSGVAAACMIAQALSSAPAPLRGVRFLFFTGEEDGRRGSRKYVERRLCAGPEAGVFVNFDVPHGGRPLLHVMCGEFDDGWFESLKSRFGEDLAFARNMRRSSDHYSFYRAGVPCLMPRAVPAGASEDPGVVIHTDLDTLDGTDLDGLQRSIVLSAALVEELAGARSLPFSPFQPLADEAENFPDPG